MIHIFQSKEISNPLIGNIDDTLSLFPEWKGLPILCPFVFQTYWNRPRIVSLTDIVNPRWRDAASRIGHLFDRFSLFNTFRPSFTNDQLSIVKKKKKRIESNKTSDSGVTISKKKKEVERNNWLNSSPLHRKHYWISINNWISKHLVRIKMIE